MSRRRGQREGGEVRGPNSALTEFLRSQGIDANEIRLRHEARTRQAARLENEEVEEISEELASLDAEVAEDVEEVIRAAGRRKRRRRDEGDEDDEDDEDYQSDGDRVVGPVRRRTRRRNDIDDQPELTLEGVDFCAICECRFTLTVYTQHTDDGKALCRNCSSKTKVKKSVDSAQLAARRQRKKVAAALLDGKELLNVPSLQDQCIATVVKNIDDVEALGEIGYINSEKISRIICRNRRLTPISLRLFLEPASRKLELWDCSSLTPDSLDLIASYCPNLETLSLGMCGQLTNENLKYFSTNMPYLKNIYLDGPFLIRKETWISFFEEIGPRLSEFHVKSTHRIDEEVIANLVQHCPNLTHLTLNRLSGLKGDASTHLLADLSKLEHLELSYLGDDFSLAGTGHAPPVRPTAEDTDVVSAEPQDDTVVTDEAIVTILNQVGSQLKTLILDGSSALTDRIINSGIRPCCGSLTTLSLGLLDQLTDHAVTKLFTNWTVNEGLVKISFKRCIGLSDSAIKALIRHSHHTVVELNLNSLQFVTGASLSLLSGCPNLTTLDLGFVRSTDNSLIELLDRTCGHLTLIEVYGDPRVTGACRVSSKRRLVGRQMDII